MPKLIDKCNDISIKIQTGYFEPSQFDPKIDMENIYLKIKILMEIKNKDMRVFLFWCQSIYSSMIKNVFITTGIYKIAENKNENLRSEK